MSKINYQQKILNLILKQKSKKISLEDIAQEFIEDDIIFSEISKIMPDKLLNVSLLEDENLIIQCLKSNYKLYEKLNPKFKSDKNIILKSFTQPQLYDLLPENLKNDRDIIFKLFESSSNSYEQLSEELKNDIDIFKLYISFKHFRTTHLIDKGIIPSHLFANNKELALELLDQNFHYYKYFSVTLQNDKELFKKAFLAEQQLSGVFFYRMSSHSVIFQDSDFILDLAKHKFVYFLCMAPSKLKNNINFINELCLIDPTYFRFGAAKVRNCEELAKLCIEKKPNILKYVSRTLRDKEELILFALNIDDKLIRYASTRIKNMLLGLSGDSNYLKLKSYLNKSRLDSLLNIDNIPAKEYGFKYNKI